MRRPLQKKTVHKAAPSEVHEIFVRAHTVVAEKQPWQRSSPAKWPDEVLVIDTETTIDTAQKLNFGAYRRCKLSASGYQCVEEGLFHADTLRETDLHVLRRYVDDPENFPGTEVKMFPPQMRLRLYNRSDFVERVFWKSIRRDAMVVAFNLPFDLSRLAVKACTADSGGWSLVLSFRKSRKTGEMEPNPERPRVVVTSIGSKKAFYSLSSILRREEWPGEGRFLDLHTFGHALRDEPYDLKGACKAFHADEKMDHTPTGTVTVEEIHYCRQDVRATVSVLNAMKAEFDRHPIDLRPDRAYSSASVAKAYLDAMGIVPPKEKFQVASRISGIAMQAYYGGRAECRIRKTPVPVVLTDFTSQYPTVNTLLGNWDVLTAESVSFEDCTGEVCAMLRTLKLEDTFNPAFWKRLSFFALVSPKKDILPVRAVYNGRTKNIGVNSLTSEKAIWSAGPEIVASLLQTQKVPKILKAIRMAPHRRQAGLTSTDLAGMVTIAPESDDFFRHVVEQKTVHKPTNRPLADFLKILGNSGSYGLFIEVNPEKLSNAVNVKVFSGEMEREKPCPIVEKPGKWYFPPLASLITAGGRLLLTMLERCVTDAGGSYLFCDTDSLCIVSNQHGGLIPCPGGAHKLDDGREAVRALSWTEVRQIADKFNGLNPYNRELVRDILKIEDVNFIDSDTRKPQRRLFGYAISSKRYVLYEQSRGDLSIVKASGHGLGYLYSPKKGFNKDADAPEWVVEAWDWLLRKELGLLCKEPGWLDEPAMMRMVLTSPNVMRGQRPEWLSPFNFFFLPLVSDVDGYPAGCNRSNFKFITPFCTDRRRWKTLTGVNLYDSEPYGMEMIPTGKQNKVVPETFRTVLRLYLRRPESKSLAPDGDPCTAETKGLLRRASVTAAEIVPVGKETDRRWEQGEDMSMVDFQVLEYRAASNMVVADQGVRDAIVMHGMRAVMRRTGESQHTLEKIRRGQAVRRATLQRVMNALGAG